MTPIEREESEYEELPGRIAAIDTVEIRARVTGYLDKVDFTEGTEVSKGDLLFSIDPSEYQAKVEAAIAGVQQAEASQAQANSDYDRAKQLGKNTVIAAQEVENKRTGMLNTTGGVRAAEAALAQAKLNLGYTEIRSPIDGKISRTSLTVGNVVDIGDTLTSVVRQDPVYVVFDVPERAVLRWDRVIKTMKGAKFSESVSANVGLLSEKGFPRPAHVDFIDNQVNANTGTLKVRAVLENDDRSARVGMYARVRLSLKQSHPTLLIPERAVGNDQGQRFVYVVGADNKVTYRRVTPGQIYGGLLSIVDGLTKDDRVVTEGLVSLRSGMVVDPTEAPES